MIFKRLAWFCLTLALVASSIDISKDPLPVFGVELRAVFPEAAAAINQFLQAALLGFAGAGMMQLLMKPPSLRREVMFVLVGLVGVVLYGACVGLAQGNEPGYVGGDSVYLLLYPGLFGLLVAPSADDLRRARNLVLLVGTIVMAKYVFVIIAGLAVGDMLGWRYFTKFSFAFLPMAGLGIAYLVLAPRQARRGWYRVAAAVGVVGVMLTNTRGFYLGFGAAIVYIFLCGRKRIAWKRLAPMIAVGFCMALIVGLAARGSVWTAFGYWSGTENFSTGVQYRVDQFAMLMRMFAKNPLSGAGLGAFDPTWEGYEPWLPRPYLVELEFVNMLAKLGAFAFATFLAVLGMLFYACYDIARKSEMPEHSAIVAGMGAGVLALTCASLTNTTYSSIYFHLYLIATLTVISYVPKSRPQPQSFVSTQALGG